MRQRFDRQIASLGHNWEKKPATAWILSALWVLLIGGLTFLWHLGSVGLVDETEPLFAEAARQMTVTGDWITPYFNGDTRFDKPPLIYWLMAIAYHTIGVNEWAARLPSALVAIGLMGMMLYTLQRFGHPALADRVSSKTLWLSAWIGAALTGLNPLTLAWGRTGVSDMLLTSCMGGALLCFFCGYASRDEIQGIKDETPVQALPLSHPVTRWYLASYGLIGLAILTKGPIGLVLPALIIGAFLFYVGNLPVLWREMRPLWGLLIILAIALPWYILVTLANGEAFIDAFFGYHNFERFTEVVNRHKAPWYFYFVVVLLGFAPWSVYLPVAIGRLQFWKRSIWQHQRRDRQLGLFAFFWLAGIFGFFTIAVTKLPSYVLPLMPAAAILVALLWSSQMSQDLSQRFSWGMKLSVLLNGAFFLIMAGVISYAPQWLEADPSQPKLATMLQTSGLVLGGSTIALAAILAGIFLWLQRHGRWLWLVNIVAMLALLNFTLMPAMILVDSQRQLPLRQLSQVVQQIVQPDERVVMVGYAKPSVVFYTQHRVVFEDDGEKVSKYLRRRAKKGDAPSALILGDRGDIKDIGLKPNQFQPIAEAGPYELIRIPQQEFTRITPPED